MTLSDPREGTSLGFSCFPYRKDEATIGDPETVILSSIRQVGSRAQAEYLARSVHGLKKKKDRSDAAGSVKLYIQQANEFYEVARIAKPNTAPLIFYYAFLNFAKALCEFKHPRLHRMPESSRHGLTWRPNPKRLIDLRTESISAGPRGVWHLLWEATAGSSCPAHNPQNLNIRYLLGYCPEIRSEYFRLFGAFDPFFDLDSADIRRDSTSGDIWLLMSLYRQDFDRLKISLPKLLTAVQSPRSTYVEVRSAEKGLRTVQSATAAKFVVGNNSYVPVAADLAALSLYTRLDEGKLSYAIASGKHLPFRMPQLIVLYSILYWLGSVVRYDPHSVDDLMDSPAWLLVDGFMSQSRLWLLELFEWALYGTETTLRLVR